ncbi:MAG TPA: EamA family transporter, partial [Noviherbaspirillum sp.]|nr:EamA family transporter [Noviherbaspirillum sp.]
MKPACKPATAVSTRTPPRAIGIAAGLAVIAIFAGFTLASRAGYAGALGPADIIALRFGVGGMILLPLFARHRLAGLSAAQAGALAASGGIGFALVAYNGLALAPASHGAVLMHGTLPLFTFGVISLIAPEHVGIRTWAGLSLIGAGILLMAGDSIAGASPRQLAGDGLLLAGSL